jgi:outer membrane protein OmpA-like peptidoglycan-associated protein
VAKIKRCFQALALSFAVILLSAQWSHAALDEQSLSQHQSIRDELFKKLMASATEYSFEYVVIYLPAGTIPGMNYPIPVSHVRYKSTVFFGFNEYELQPGADQVLADLTQAILKDRNLRSLLVVGHTDAIGTEQYNTTLSLKRAATVAKQLHAAGLRDEYISVIPMGKAQPVATNKTAEGRSKNRRVEFFISDIPEATLKTVERIKFNPCFRNDNDTKVTECDNSALNVPVYPGSTGLTRPRILVTLKGVPSERPKLPIIILQRPPLPNLSDDLPLEK